MSAAPFTQLELARALPLPSELTQSLRRSWHAAAVARQRQCDSPEQRMEAERAYTIAHTDWHAHRRALSGPEQSAACDWWLSTECGRVPSRCVCGT